MIGILGGSFDPIHFGHLRLALEMSENLALREVRLIPCGVPPHRPAPLASSAQRLEMLRVAISDTAQLVIDERELRCPEPSYTVDTLYSLRSELGATPLCLILGMDAFLKLNTWRRWRELISLAHIVVAHRPEARAEPPGEIAELLAERYVDQPSGLTGSAAGHILYAPITQLAISSSGIRALLADGKSPRYLLPDAVLAMITSYGLYRTLC